MKATWILADGREITAEVAEGTTLMEAGLANSVPRILGECGGNMSCATCHVVVAPDWVAKTDAPQEHEDMMLDVTEAERRDGSRLSCQLIMGAELDGIRLFVPE